MFYLQFNNELIFSLDNVREKWFDLFRVSKIDSLAEKSSLAS